MALPKPLALPTPELVGEMPPKVVECAAGNGVWAHVLRASGRDVVAIDPRPMGAGVVPGSHRDLGAHSDRALLVVWPPDGTDMAEWFAAWGGEWACVVGDTSRFDCPTFGSLIGLPPGSKGPNTAMLGSVR